MNQSVEATASPKSLDFNHRARSVTKKAIFGKKSRVWGFTLAGCVPSATVYLETHSIWVAYSRRCLRKLTPDSSDFGKKDASLPEFFDESGFDRHSPERWFTGTEVCANYAGKRPNLVQTTGRL